LKQPARIGHAFNDGTRCIIKFYKKHKEVLVKIRARISSAYFALDNHSFHYLTTPAR